jgi:amino acid transporter
MLAVAHGNTTQNINTGFWAILQGQESWLKWLLYAGPIIMIICTIFMRGNTIAQVSLYGGTTLQPLSKEGYISNKFSELNSNHFPAQAMKLNVIIVGITIGL